VVAVQPAIADVDGAAYVAWTETAAGTDAVRVARWSGSAWVAVGGSLLDAGAVADYSPVSITSAGSSPAVPYVSFAEQPGGTGPTQVHVDRFVSGAWQPAGGSLNTVPSRDARYVQLATVASAVVVAFEQEEDASHTVKSHVATWTGSAWSALGGGIGADVGYNGTEGLAALDGQPALLHLVDPGTGGGPALVLSRWTGAAWAQVGPDIGRTNSGTRAALTVSNGVPIVVWVYTSDIYFMTGARFNGTTWVSTGEVPHGGTFGVAEPSLADIGGTAHLVWWDWDGTGRLRHSAYVVDPDYTNPGFDRAWGRNAIQGNPQDFEICTVAYLCQYADGEGGEGGSFFAVTGTAIDPNDGSVWTADEGGSRISKFAADGSFLFTAGKSVGAHDVSQPDVDRCEVEPDCIEGEQGTLGGQFNAPTSIDTDAAGNVYVADNENGRVQELDSTGHFIRAWGFGVTGTSGFGVCTVASACTAVTFPATQPSHAGGVLQSPVGLAVGPDNSVYVTDVVDERITKYTTSSTPTDVHFDRTWGRGVLSGNPGAGLEICLSTDTCHAGVQGEAKGELGDPQGIAVHGSQVFVHDSNNNRVQVFGTDGSWQRAWGKDVVAGNAQTGFEVCLPADVCKTGEPGSLGGEIANLSGGGGFYGVDGISVSSAGDVYVSDSDQRRVQIYSSSGTFERTFGKDVISGGPDGYEVCTVAADCKAGEQGGLGGEFGTPLGVAVGADGAVTVADQSLRRMQEFREGTPGAAYAFSSATYSHAESGSQTITVVRSGNTSGAGSVHYATSNGTALAGSDYSATSGDLSFTAGQTTKTFDVAITPDLLDEPDETVQLALSSPSAGDHVTNPGNATLTIVDDDVPTPPALDTVIDEGPSGETYVSTPSFTFRATIAGSTFECRIDGAAFAPCTVPYVASVLGTGAHSFDVRAVAGGQVDQTPAHRDFSIGGAQSVSGDCTVTPYPVPKTSGEVDLCRIGGHLVQCSGNYHCVPKDMDCPAGSRCTMTTTATWRDDDKSVNWTVLARARHFADKDEHNHEKTCPTGGKSRCSVTAVDSGVVPLGAQHATADWANAVCYSTPANLRGASYGAASERRIDCHGVLDYEPSQAVQPVASGSSVQVLAPGAGTLTLSSSGTARVAARGRKPTFSTVTQAVGGEGVLTFNPKLSKKLKKKLKHGRKVKLTVYSTYRSPGGTVVRSSAKVTLQKSPKLKHTVSGRIEVAQLRSLF
jgi:tripartite motif-containing protein 71